MTVSYSICYIVYQINAPSILFKNILYQTNAPLISSPKKKKEFSPTKKKKIYREENRLFISKSVIIFRLFLALLLIQLVKVVGFGLNCQSLVHSAVVFFVVLYVVSFARSLHIFASYSHVTEMLEF